MPETCGSMMSRTIKSNSCEKFIIYSSASFPSCTCSTEYPSSRNARDKYCPNFSSSSTISIFIVWILLLKKYFVNLHREVGRKMYFLPPILTQPKFFHDVSGQFVLQYITQVQILLFYIP